jgi:hypothetical protein
MDERKFIERLIKTIEEKSDRGPVSEWTNHYFFLLSCDIEDKTGHRISESTLTRILGKKKTSKRFYNPQVQTKNILANFLDYPNWHAFKNDLTGTRKSEVTYAAKPAQARSGYNKNLFWLLIVPLAVVTWLIIMDQRSRQISFEKENPDSSVPYTAIFNYDLNNIRDSVFIDFGNYEKYYLDPQRNMITQYYRSAGTPDVTVYTEQKQLASIKLHNRSDVWQVGTSPNDTIAAYRPIEPQPDFMSGDTFFISPAKFREFGLEMDPAVWIEYRITKDFRISLDSILFTCNLKNNLELGGKRCFDGEILLLGSNNDIRLRFMEPGCTRYALIRVSEISRNGRFENLEEFAVDLSDWVNVGIATRNGQADIILDQDTIYMEKYAEPLGELWGIVLRFYGNGAAHSVSVIQQ